MAIQQGFPQLASPIADGGNGFRVTQPWLQFFISIWNRTGAQQGGATFNPGDLKAIAGPTLPDGWLLCDGSAVSRTQFTALFNAITTTWGAGDNVTTFNLPNLAGRSLIGASATFPLGSTGGTTSTTIDVLNLPAHSHSVNDPGHFHPVIDPGHFHSAASLVSNVTSGSASGGSTTGNTGTAFTGITTDTAATGLTTNNTGGGLPLSTLSPYAAVQWIIKT